jgi:hypothetical protein
MEDASRNIANNNKGREAGGQQCERRSRGEEQRATETKGQRRGIPIKNVIKTRSMTV